MLRPAAVALALLLASPVAAADDVVPHRLDDAALTATFIGATVAGAYNNNGASFVETTGADGTTHYVEDGVVRQVGRWWVGAGLVCYDYGLPDTGGCFEVWQRSANCFDSYGTDAGVARAGWVARVTGFGWDSRMWRTDAPSTCPADAVADAGGAVLASTVGRRR